MPIYEYKCVDCGGRDSRVAGIDDYTALCAACGGLMLRLDDDLCSRILPRIEEGNMARKKVEGLNGWEGADQALRLIGIWERGIEAAEARMQEAIDKAKAKAKIEVKELQAAIKMQAVVLNLFCLEHAAELGPKKSKQLNFGILGFRWSTRITLPREKTKLAEIIQKLKDLGRKQCIQVKETVLKEEVKKLDAGDLSDLEGVGVRKQAGDAFFYEVKRERIQEAP